MLRSVGADPEGAIADPGSTLQVGFEGLALQLEEAVAIKLLHGPARLIGAIQPQDIVLVTGDDEEIRANCNRPRGIAHTEIPCRPDQVQVGGG